MKDRFWEWIATVNARLVFLWTSLVCLGLLSSGILLGGHGSTTIDPLLLLGDPYDLQELQPVSSRFATRPASEQEIADEDPFASELLVSLQEQEQRRKDEAKRRAKAAEQAKPPEPEPAPEPVPPTRQATLLYRGMFTRPDGSVLALIENQSSGETAFLGENDRIEGLRIGRISRSEVCLGDPEKEPITLAPGTPAQIALEPR